METQRAQGEVDRHTSTDRGIGFVPEMFYRQGKRHHGPLDPNIDQG